MMKELRLDYPIEVMSDLFEVLKCGLHMAATEAFQTKIKTGCGELTRNDQS
jgi:hypothetical protein